jgi:hypothetical protein
MNKIDTDINNYSTEEILTLLNISPDPSCELNNVFCILIEALDKINETPNVANKKNILLFFRQCFYKICNFYNLKPSDSMKKNIDSKLIEHQLIEHQLIEHDKKTALEEAGQFIGALPLKVPAMAAVSSNIDKYARGLVNPIQREMVNNILTLNSKFRDFNGKYQYDKNNTSTDFSIVLTEPFNNVVSLKLASLEFMNAYYSISEYLKTNLFTIKTYKINTISHAVSDVYVREIQLSEGSYTPALMESTLNVIFAADASLNMVSAVMNPLKGKIYFQLNNTPSPPGTTYGFNLYFTIAVDPERPLFLNLGWLLGYKKKEYIFTKNYQTTPTVTKEIGFNPESPLDFSGTKFFLLEVTDYNNNAPAVLKYNNVNDRYGFNVKDILAKIPNSVATYSILFEDSSDRVFKTRKYFGPINLQKMRIRLLDENGKVIDLNESELIISFEIETLDVPYKNKV